MMPDRGAAIAFKPGMNLATSSTRGPLRVKLTWVLRTQESGSSEIRQSNWRTRTPFRRPSSYHIESLATAPRVANAMAIPRFIWCVPESAPAARSSGAEGTGRPACSTKTHANTSMYPCRTTNWSNLGHFISIRQNLRSAPDVPMRPKKQKFPAACAGAGRSPVAATFPSTSRDLPDTPKRSR